MAGSTALTDGPRDTDGLRHTVEQLAPIRRLPCSTGERETAQIIAARLRGLGCEVTLEEEPAYSSYARPVGALGALAAVAGFWPKAAGGRAVAMAAGLAAAAGIADEISYGRQAARRMVSRRTTTWNVVAETSDRSADRTLVITAHHDAAPTGAIFDQTAERWFVRRFPGVAAKMTENPPLWWLALAGPLLVATGGRRARKAGAVLAAVTAAAMADIAARGPVPGANDNLSGVAVLIALAEELRARPVRGLRVLLVSAGAEEALQQGIRAFVARHDLPREATRFLNVDTVGSGNLVLLDAEGPLRMEPYDAAFGDLVEDCARKEGIEMLRGLRSRNSTDGVAPNRAGYVTASLVSIDGERLLPHYHLPSDTPEHVDYACVADAVRLCRSVMDRFSAGSQRGAVK